jgi:hypothetical protein
MGRFAKFVRPETPVRGVISDRDLDIIEAILRYRFIPASALVRLVGGNEDVTHRRLRKLWEWSLINRWVFPGIRTHSEFHYYLDNRNAIDTLVQHGRVSEPHPQMLEEIRNNRDKDYAGAAYRGQHMQLGFLQHSLMISRMHFMLEMACRDSNNVLQAWTQGPELAGRKVEVPRIKSTRRENEYFWQEDTRTEMVPVEPDAMFSIRFHPAVHEGWVAHFFYEADRGTMNTTDMFRKLRAYYHLVKKQQKHREAFGVHPIRAILVETTTEARAQRLMELVRHPLLGGRDRRVGLFWFTISSLFASEPSEEAKPGKLVPIWLTAPRTILTSVWAMADHSLRALDDPENS